MEPSKKAIHDDFGLEEPDTKIINDEVTKERLKK